MGAAVKVAVGKAALALVLDSAYGDMLHTNCGLVVDIATLNRDHGITLKCVMCPYTVSLADVRPGAANPADEIASVFMAHRQASLQYDRECSFVVARETAIAAAVNNPLQQPPHQPPLPTFRQIPDDVVSFMKDYEVLNTVGANSKH